MKSSIGDINFVKNGSYILFDKPAFNYFDRKYRKSSLANSSSSPKSNNSNKKKILIVQKNRELIDSIKKYPLN